MQLVPKKYFLLFLASISVVFMGLMALTLSKRPVKQVSMTEQEMEIKKIQTQSESDVVEDIEQDLNETDLLDVDKELQDIEGELDVTY